MFHAGVAHPVERHLAKVEVASSSLVTRSIKKQLPFGSCFFMPIGQNHLCDRLVFKRMRFGFPVIANQAAAWCGNPPVRGKMFVNCPTE